MSSLSSLAVPSLPPRLLSLETLPPLPPIVDLETSRLARTHSSFHKKPKSATNLNWERETIDDWEKYEHVGDQLLGTVVTCLLNDLFPTLKHGPATIIRAHLVSNAVLAQISVAYDIPSTIIADPIQSSTLQGQVDQQAAMFEAHIAGIYLSNVHDLTEVPIAPVDARTVGMSIIDIWLREVFEPLAHWMMTYLRNAQGQVRAASTLPSLVLTQPITTSSPLLQEEEEEDGEVTEFETIMTAEEVDDNKVRGASVRLNEHCIGRIRTGKPEYEDFEVGHQIWQVKCTATDRQGKTWSAQATRSTKKMAASVAAWKICRQMGLK